MQLVTVSRLTSICKRASSFWRSASMSASLISESKDCWPPSDPAASPISRPSWNGSVKGVWGLCCSTKTHIYYICVSSKGPEDQQRKKHCIIKKTLFLLLLSLLILSLLLFMWLHIVTVLHISWVTPQRMWNIKNCGSAHRNLLRLSHSSALSTDHAVSHFASQQTLQAKVLTPSHTNALEHISSPDPWGETLWKTISLTPLCASSCSAKKFAQFPSSGTVMMWVEVGR